MSNKPDLIPGDWFTVHYGFSRMRVYILGFSHEYQTITWCNVGWMVSSAKTESADEFWDSTHRNPLFIGHSRKKWYWRFLPWRDLVCPYRNPKP